MFAKFHIGKSYRKETFGNIICISSKFTIKWARYFPFDTQLIFSKEYQKVEYDDIILKSNMKGVFKGKN